MARDLIRNKKDLPVHKISDLYDIESTLSNGTHGKTYQVRCKRTQDTLALMSISKSEANFGAFKQEVNHSYFLSAHTSIVTTYPVAFQTTESWVFLQEASGLGSVCDAVTPGLGIDVEAAKIVICQVTDALKFMHSNKLCHGNIRPENIQLFNYPLWTVKIKDFGQTYKAHTQVVKKAHNNTYTPPEACSLVLNEPYKMCTSSDVWQLGITLYYLLMGKHPWTVADKSDLFYNAFLGWRKYYTTSHIPSGWKSFNNRLLKLFRKLLHPVRKERCDIREMYKYIKVNWEIKTDTEFIEAESYLTAQSKSSDSQDAKAKANLQRSLSSCGVKTTINKSYKRMRVETWLRDNVNLE